ncbi:hypothetical protein NDU88_004565 [Pleurodeles waltl]|uniref:Uncharacterized protein n=1 Tax=Pleurodeles waltl TaxID=8319 RepID=A0AAV7PCW2_PLEWA|nr:hypothetical protein NDU88_004565 [Pleurodeles waltl]
MGPGPLLASVSKKGVLRPARSPRVYFGAGNASPPSLALPKGPRAKLEDAAKVRALMQMRSRVYKGRALWWKYVTRQPPVS